MTQATTRVHGFRIALVQLKVLASQAAVSLENTQRSIPVDRSVTSYIAPEMHDDRQ